MIKNILIVFLFSIFFSIQVFAQNKILEFNKNTEFVFPKWVNIQNYTISTSFVYPDSIIELPKFTWIVKAFHDKYGTQKMKSFIDNINQF